MQFRLPSIDAATLIRGWALARKLPGGKVAFSKAVAQLAPYTASIGARIEALEPGYARLRLDDRRAVRNHLGSIHAIALANLAEEVSGLAVISSLPEGSRGIITEINVRYLKKARGRLTAECRAPELKGIERRSYEIVAHVNDASGALVCQGTMTWLIGPR